jgi:S-adenosylmethionine decarboxylase
MSQAWPSDNTAGFFEGAEKLLEIWFKFSPTSGGLKLISRKSWEVILEQVNCAILSCRHNARMDAYLLSESSMFVTKERLVLKTCGSTTLLLALRPLLDCISREVGLYEIFDLFYSRKAFLEPSLQQFPHCSFEEEVKYIRTFFPGGRSYSLGPKDSQWHLFVLHGTPFQSRPDRTFEVLMNNISSEARELFLYKNYPSDQLMTKCCGFHSIFPQAELDAKAFEPWGYSLNIVLQEDKYCNIHVTPQEECSYASFETNSSSVSD